MRAQRRTWAPLLREAAAVIQVDANMQAMDEFAEVTSAGHLSELVHDMRRKLHMLADDVEDQEEIRGDPLARDLREIAGDMHRPLPLLASKGERVHELVNTGRFAGMSESFDAHMGAACWADQDYDVHATTWAAAWRACVREYERRLRDGAAHHEMTTALKPLTLDQIGELELGGAVSGVPWDAIVSIVRATERALREGAAQQQARDVFGNNWPA